MAAATMVQLTLKPEIVHVVSSLFSDEKITGTGFGMGV